MLEDNLSITHASLLQLSSSSSFLLYRFETLHAVVVMSHRGKVNNTATFTGGN